MSDEKWVLTQGSDHCTECTFLYEALHDCSIKVYATIHEKVIQFQRIIWKTKHIDDVCIYVYACIQNEKHHQG